MATGIQPQPNKRGCLWWVARILLGLVALVVIAAGGILFAGAKAKSDLKAKYPPPGTLVDVGGYRMHIFCQGTGSPTVIMETGLGDPSVMWELVRPEVAKATRTCVYDRAGLGWSDASPKPRTAQNTVEELHTLLTNAGIAGPYVLVGHSMGGALVRLYAHTYPEGVVGMVLVDSSHEDQFARFPAEYVRFGDEADQQNQQQDGSMKRLVGIGILALIPRPSPPSPQLPQAAWDAYQSFFAVDTKTMDTAQAESSLFKSNLDQVRAAQITTVGNIPLIVLSHGRADQLPPGPGLTPEVLQQVEQVWHQMQVELSQLSPQGKQVMATESGHYIQLDQPQLVIDAINQVVADARK